MDPAFATPPSASLKFKTIISPRNKYEVFMSLTIKLFQNELLLLIFITLVKAYGLLAKIDININGGLVSLHTVISQAQFSYERTVCRPHQSQCLIGLCSS
jgi:hypothetical protein